ncbi:TubC N-terminal docking domain-related protein, partial [Microbulbifer taiwanensis]
MTTFALINELNTKGIELWHENGDLKVKAPKGALTADLREKLVSSKPDIIAFLQEISATDRMPSIQAITRAEPNSVDCNHLPLSFSQQRLWFIDNLQGGSPEYNMPMAFEVTGHLNLP